MKNIFLDHKKQCNLVGMPKLKQLARIEKVPETKKVTFSTSKFLS